MSESRAFRCPFELKGEKDKTILKVTLPTDRRERMKLITKTIRAFEGKPKSPGIKFKLPPEILKQARSNKDLLFLLLPFQMEIMAAQLENAVGAFALYRMKKFPERRKEENDVQKLTDIHIAAIVHKTMHNLRFKTPEKTADIADWLYSMMLKGISEGGHNPNLSLRDSDYKKEFAPLVTIGPGGITFPVDRDAKHVPSSKNRNTFCFVLSPFYPRAFGRFSPDVEIVVTRERDFNAIPPEERRPIRRRSNKVLQEHGIEIKDLSEDKNEHAGVWIPAYTDSSAK